MSNAAQEVLAVYNAAVERVRNKTATIQDKLLVNLWDDNKEMQAEISAMNYKLSILETREATQISDFDKQELLSEANKAIQQVRYLH